MDNKEKEKDKSNVRFDKGNNQNEYQFLVQKLKSIKEIIDLLEKKLFQKEM